MWFAFLEETQRSSCLHNFAKTGPLITNVIIRSIRRVRTRLLPGKKINCLARRNGVLPLCKYILVSLEWLISETSYITSYQSYQKPSIKKTKKNIVVKCTKKLDGQDHNVWPAPKHFRKVDIWGTVIWSVPWAFPYCEESWALCTEHSPAPPLSRHGSSFLLDGC